jgi:hypothetical protein
MRVFAVILSPVLRKNADVEGETEIVPTLTASRLCNDLAGLATALGIFKNRSTTRISHGGPRRGNSNNQEYQKQ